MTEKGLGLVITNVPRQQWYAPISSGPVVIGRGKTVDVLVPQSHASVSRRHVKVWRDHANVWICDLKSTCGTTVNGLPLVPGREVRIANGDRILLGNLEMTLIDETYSSGIHSVESPAVRGEETVSFEPLGDDCLNSVIGGLELLSSAEQEVVLWVSRGYTSPIDIGRQLKRSPHTVRTQLNSIFKKLSVHSRDELAGYLLRNRRSDGTSSGGSSR